MWFLLVGSWVSLPDAPRTRYVISPTSTRSSAKIRFASAMRYASPAAAGEASSTLATTQRTLDCPAQALPDTVLDHVLLALGHVLEKRLFLGEAERDDSPLDRDRAAGDDERLGRWMLADPGDDRRPGGEELLESIG
jgi:hypothetical protein